jgi:hypothetical protein
MTERPTDRQTEIKKKDRHEYEDQTNIGTGRRQTNEKAGKQTGKQMD